MKFCSHFLVQVSLARLRLFFYDDDDDDEDDNDDVLACVVLRPRIANRLVDDSYCRGGIVNLRVFVEAAFATASLSQGALAVSRKYFKQSKWPFMATSIIS